uniref:Homeobox domain-containing protein n=1 Tax=Meloidogyne hapla TaxID=6305 RepID=A0A1I8BB14_MELHA
MHNDHMNEVKTLKDEIKQKLEENLSSKDQLNAILSRINNFLEEEIDEIHEPKQGDEIKKEHVGFLENYYKNCCCYPDERSVSALAFGIDVTRDRVVKWFKSRRRRSRINYEYRKVIEENDTDSDDFLMLSIFDIFGYENEKEKNDIKENEKEQNK